MLAVLAVLSRLGVAGLRGKPGWDVSAAVAAVHDQKNDALVRGQTEPPGCLSPKLQKHKLYNAKLVGHLFLNPADAFDPAWGTNRTQGDGLTQSTWKFDRYNEEFKRDLPFVQQHLKPLAAKYACARCAVVGSSGNLLGKGYGKDIDAHDVVFRFNDAPIHAPYDPELDPESMPKTFEADVGSKDTVRMVYPESCFTQYAETSDTLLWVTFKAEDMNFYATEVFGSPNRIERRVLWRNTSCVTEQRSLLGRKYADKSLVMLPTLFEHAQQFTNYYASTGFVGIVVALHLCKEVSLYGFSLGAPEKTATGDTPYHYWTKEHAYTKMHSMCKEMTALQVSATM
jgi:hypothetical protein